MVFFGGVVILVVFKVFLVKNLEISTQIVPEVSIYPYYNHFSLSRDLTRPRGERVV